MISRGAHIGREAHSQGRSDLACESVGDERSDRIADLLERVVHRAGKLESVWKGLEASGFAHGDRSCLGIVVVDVRVAIVAEVSHEGAGGAGGIDFAPFVGELLGGIGGDVGFA